MQLDTLGGKHRYILAKTKIKKPFLCLENIVDIGQTSTQNYIQQYLRQTLKMDKIRIKSKMLCIKIEQHAIVNTWMQILLPYG